MDILSRILLIFLITQVCYFGVNLLTVLFIYRNDEQVVSEKLLPHLPEYVPNTSDSDTLIDWNNVENSKQPIINVLIPIYHERPEILYETVTTIFQQTYPSQNIRVHIYNFIYK